MKVLFAVGNEKISEAIIKEYQKNYSEEIISKMYIILMQYRRNYKKISHMIE